MSETTKPKFVPTQAHLTQIHIPAEVGDNPYNVQILNKIDELFAAAPADETKILIGIDLGSFTLRTDEAALIRTLADKGMSYQVVQFGGKTGKNTGVLVTRQLPTNEA